MRTTANFVIYISFYNNASINVSGLVNIDLTLTQIIGITKPNDIKLLIMHLPFLASSSCKIKIYTKI